MEVKERRDCNSFFHSVASGGGGESGLRCSNKKEIEGKGLAMKDSVHERREFDTIEREE